MKNLIIILLSVFTLSSCVSFRHAQQRMTTTLNPNVVELNLTMDDFTYLGTTEISTKSRRYFGLFSTIDSVNQKPYNSRVVSKTVLSGLHQVDVKGPLKKASYKIIEAYPNADFFIAKSSYTKIKQMFMGRWIWHYMEVDAYRYNCKPLNE